eukprot:PITA_33650
MSTPKEAYSGKRTDISHLRIFGSPVYMHVMKDARKKLEPTAEVGIFVGYTDTPHSYHVYLLDSCKTVVRRDIKFQEEKAMKCLLEREPHLHADKELLVPKDELQDVDHPQDEVHGVEETTHAAPTIRGQKRTTEAERLAQDAEKVKQCMGDCPKTGGEISGGSRWIYKVKQVADGSVEKYKARFVARGFSQIEGIDYEETFAPIARYSSIWTILALSA